MGLKHHPRVVTNGLIYYLDAANTRCYSGSGLTANALIGGIGATLVNGTGFTSTNNGAFTFDGTNDYIAVDGSNFPLGSSAKTLGIWFYTKASTSAGNVNNLFWYGTQSARQSFGVDFDTYPLMEFFSWADDINWNTTGPQEGWRNLQITYDGIVALRVYEAGILVTSKTFGGTLNTVLSSNVQIGAITGLNGYFDSNISQVTMYNRALSAQEILQNYNATKKRYGL